MSELNDRLANALNEYKNLVLVGKKYFGDNEADKVEVMEMCKDLVKRCDQCASIVNKLKDANKSIETKVQILQCVSFSSS
jgi:hypothetical protein